MNNSQLFFFSISNDDPHKVENRKSEQKMSEKIEVNFNTLKNLRTINDSEKDYHDLLDDLREELEEYERQDILDEQNKVDKNQELCCNCSQC